MFRRRHRNLYRPSQPHPDVYERIRPALVELAETDDRIVAVTAAMSEGTGLAQFAEAYPDRFFDVGIAEQHGVNFAAGMATEGFRPVVAIYSTSLQRAFDQVLHDVCLESIPVVFALDRGGIVGEDGATHHGLFDLSYLRILPNMVVMAPKDENELRRMMVTALSHRGPIALRYPRGTCTGCTLDPDPDPIPIGKAEIVCEGDDLLILAAGRCVSDAMEAKEAMRSEGISATIVNSRFVKPLDADLILNLVQRIPRVITVEEHVLSGGFGSAVLELFADSGISGVPVKRIGIGDVFVEHGSQSILRSRHGVDRVAIEDAARAIIQCEAQPG